MMILRTAKIDGVSRAVAVSLLSVLRRVRQLRIDPTCRTIIMGTTTTPSAATLRPAETHGRLTASTRPTTITANTRVAVIGTRTAARLTRSIRRASMSTTMKMDTTNAMETETATRMTMTSTTTTGMGMMMMRTMTGQCEQTMDAQLEVTDATMLEASSEWLTFFFYPHFFLLFFVLFCFVFLHFVVFYQFLSFFLPSYTSFLLFWIFNFSCPPYLTFPPCAYLGPLARC